MPERHLRLVRPDEVLTDVPSVRLDSLFELDPDLTVQDLFFEPGTNGRFFVGKRENDMQGNGDYLHRPEDRQRIVARVINPTQPIDTQKGLGDILLIPISPADTVQKVTLVLGTAAQADSQFEDNHSEVDVLIGGGQVTLSAFGGRGVLKREIGLVPSSPLPVVIGRNPSSFGTSINTDHHLTLSDELVARRGISRVHFLAFLVGQKNGLPPCVAIEPLAGFGTYIKPAEQK